MVVAGSNVQGKLTAEYLILSVNQLIPPQGKPQGFQLALVSGSISRSVSLTGFLSLALFCTLGILRDFSVVFL